MSTRIEHQFTLYGYKLVIFAACVRTFCVVISGFYISVAKFAFVEGGVASAHPCESNCSPSIANRYNLSGSGQQHKQTLWAVDRLQTSVGESRGRYNAVMLSGGTVNFENIIWKANDESVAGKSQELMPTWRRQDFPRGLHRVFMGLED